MTSRLATPSCGSLVSFRECEGERSLHYGFAPLSLDGRPTPVASGGNTPTLLGQDSNTFSLSKGTTSTAGKRKKKRRWWW